HHRRRVQPQYQIHGHLLRSPKGDPQYQSVGHWAVFTDQCMQSIAEKLHAFKSLETLVLVVHFEIGRDKGSSTRAIMENHLVKTKDQLVLRGKCKEWKLPAVKVMGPQAFAN